MENGYDILTVLGPTATGKTALAVALATRLDGEILSADSRQVYRGMDIGTGKDLAEYAAGGQPVPYHLIDIADAGYKYNLYEYQRDFAKAYKAVVGRGKTPILCGGTGLYIEAVLGGYRLVAVPENAELRAALSGKTLPELAEILRGYKTLHNTTDIDTPKRAIRAIEIADYSRRHPEAQTDGSKLKPLIIGVGIDRELRRRKITERLRSRLESGMVEEVENLLNAGVRPEDLTYYGLEYKFVTNYLTGNLTYEALAAQLEIAIHQFAKRQMTWFRGMERRGFAIHWLDATWPMAEKVDFVEKLWRPNRWLAPSQK